VIFILQLSTISLVGNGVYADSPDSLIIYTGSDTLKLRSVYSIEIPAYSAAADTSEDKRSIKLQSPESGLDAVGSISRGIQVSSNSSVSLQSSMYLKIKGNLNDDYSVSGVLTDKTSPLQPIGNTRRLNDFDRVMVAIDGPALNAAIGDIDLQLNNGKFGKVDRSIEGVTFRANSHRGSLSGALGFSYGKYHLLQIQGKNGKQGPYRLTGKEGEKFIIVLAGSEKIKLDDQLLVRGEDFDYIIDYNAAEIHFTQNNILSSNSRISIEFEYVPDIYLSSYSFGKQFTSGEIAIGTPANSNFYLSAAWQDIRDDQKNPLGNIEASELREIFGDLDSGSGRTELSTHVLDTLYGSYDLDSTGLLSYMGEGLGTYRVEFNFVGLERGEYRREQSLNGVYFVYDSVLGEYLPTKQYTAAQSLSVISLTGHAKGNGLEAVFDIGLSKENQNLYAAKQDQENHSAWDVNIGLNRPYFELRLGNKTFSEGYVGHDALESLEYYRKWQITNRIAEPEMLQYGFVRLGNINSDYMNSTLSGLERSGSIVGRQVLIDSRSDIRRPLSAHYAGTVTELDTTSSQQHSFTANYKRGKFSTAFSLGMEEGSANQVYVGNDHLRSGIELEYAQTSNQSITLSFEERRDYNLVGPDQVIITNINNWSDQRLDWMGEYSFKNTLDASGSVNMKYRHHSNQSDGVNQYYLGKFQVDGYVLDKRLKYEETFLLDEEHIPKYDYHYIEVDTGYGDHSFDPAIQDYIPLHGGRFIRQRVFSDIEEQVRKYDNKSRLDFTTQSYSKPGQIALRSRFGFDKRLKEEVVTGSTIQDQSSLTSKFDLQTGKQRFVTKLSYSGRATLNISTLYNYGQEKNQFRSHDLLGDVTWNSSNQSTLGVLYERRERSLEYNALAREAWTSSRPYFQHTLRFSPQQSIEGNLKYSMVNDENLSKDYSELFMEVKHSLRFKRRGRLDQKLFVSNIKADVNAIPYSVFSGRQPGDNWKYSLNGRYTFSSMFQVSLNYSLQKRGENHNEQYLRVEGRTHF